MYLRLLEDLGEEPLLFEPPDLRGLSIEQAASKTRDWLGLYNCKDFDAYRKAVEAKGILVFRSNGYQGRWQIAKDVPFLGFFSLSSSMSGNYG